MDRLEYYVDNMRLRDKRNMISSVLAGSLVIFFKLNKQIIILFSLVITFFVLKSLLSVGGLQLMQLLHIQQMINY